MFSKAGQELLQATQADHDQINALLARGADLNEIDPEEGVTVFSEYVFGYRDTIHDLLKLGARATVPGQHGGNALIYAVWSLDYGLLRHLLQSGADPNHLAYTLPGEFPMTVLDAVADGYHTEDDPYVCRVLDAMEALIKHHGGHYADERTNP